MNIKLLKFIVIFMGFIIFFGVISLGIALYFKFKNLSSSNSIDAITINKPYKMNFLDYKLYDEKIYLSFENTKKLLINIYSIKTGKFIKKIEILK
ncbi:MAG: hypothetical protein CMJ13_06030 [Pelagibacterales bacterium]|nr:hypothetical protein [Pelagibacterales bacterium]|tara:strand:+ start:616 stop:900 length:285 start_codon:yes stop_codon:yes gene_type:complete